MALPGLAKTDEQGFVDAWGSLYSGTDNVVGVEQFVKFTSVSYHVTIDVNTDLPLLIPI